MIKLFILLLCTFSKFVFADDLVNFPADWGGISPNSIANTACPSLEGRYSEFSWGYIIENGKESSNINTSPRIISKHEMHPSQDALNLDQFKDSFYIRQEDDNVFVITKFDQQFWKAVISAEFTKTGSKLICTDGWWVVPSEDINGGTENYSIVLSATRYFTVLANGDLVVHFKTVSKRSDWFIFNKVNTSDSFYRFKSLSLKKNE